MFSLLKKQNMFHTIDQIKPYEHNAKLHPDWHIEKIANSIRAFGCLQPIVVDKDGILVAGHGRFKAMTEKLGFTVLRETGSAKKGEAYIPYVIANDLTDDEVKAYRLADNQLNMMTGLDMQLVMPEIESMSVEMQELTGIELPDFSQSGTIEDQGDVSSVEGDTVKNKLISAVSGYMKHYGVELEDVFEYVRDNIEN